MSATLPPSETRRVRVGEISLHVRIDGGDGPWVVLAHALGANHTLWDATARHLAPRYRVLRYDLRGHGQSDAPIGAYSMIRLADDVACLMDALEVPAAHFVGVSVGGMIGQTAAVRHPERLLSLTLVDTVNRTPLDAHPMWHERIGHVEAHGMAGVADSTMQRWLSAAFRGAHPQEAARVREMLLATPVHGYVGTSLAIMAFDLAGAIPRIHCPTLVVAGEEDLGAPPALAREIAAAIPGARLEILPHAAHLAHIEQADRFHAVLDAFLGNAACGAQCDVP
ncbi:3-oxoadipate enol-lactonase [Cupriavidus sp. CuC1]|uniref:3-oxoadipate enol-lactonase n=1 Tax=Cupriavidus sp. CuC1 TaxID=3373131 RepID=UPI0037D0F7A0